MTRENTAHAGKDIQYPAILDGTVAQACVVMATQMGHADGEIRGSYAGSGETLLWTDGTEEGAFQQSLVTVTLLSH